MTLRRIVQISCLLLFLILLGISCISHPSWIPVDTFLRMDPAVWIAATAAAGWVARLWPALAVMAATLLLGRFFCGWVCPLGTSIDAFEALARVPRTSLSGREAAGIFRMLDRIRYHLLFFIVGAALAGLPLVFLLSPMVLASRFYGLILFPMLQTAMKSGLTAIRPLGEILDIPALIFAEISTRGYNMLGISVLLSLLIFLVSFHSPRFWCRFLCPAGAVFSLLSRLPGIRRTVSPACTDCGMCRKTCPANAIGNNPAQTAFSQCIVCETCMHICPVEAVGFRLPVRRDKTPCAEDVRRRRFLASGLAGAASALLAWTGAPLPEARSGEPGRGPVIRPPGARPEPEFLVRCIRCGVCMASCPTNTLQPRDTGGGILSLLSPVIVPRVGPCEPDCRRCSQVCPTDAIRPLPAVERPWSKIGTAVILRNQCIVWEKNRKCLVCDEVCPYDAVELRHVPDRPHPLPFVTENRCSGCGYCEYHCPVKPAAAIVVHPRDEIRISTGSPKQAAVTAGFDLRRNRKPIRPASEQNGETAAVPAPLSAGDGLPPGFSAYPEFDKSKN